jgi:hypothetical protein
MNREKVEDFFKGLYPWVSLMFDLVVYLTFIFWTRFSEQIEQAKEELRFAAK